jgi:outer membrane lipoprotein-sorting protein
MKHILITLALCLSFTAAAFAQNPTARAIVEKVNDLVNQDQIQAQASMTIATSSGDKRTFVYESYSKDKGEKNLLKYLSPTRVKGQAILMLNNADDIWAYFPHTNRVRKLATHAKKQKFEGSDFSYEDLGSGDAWLTDFADSLLPDDKLDGQDCFVIDMIKKPNAESGYSRQVMWVRKDNYYPIQIDYYDENDSTYLTKRLTLSDIQQVEGIPTAMKMTMHNMDDNSQTTMVYDSVTYKVNLPDELFTERGMKE